MALPSTQKRQVDRFSARNEVSLDATLTLLHGESTATVACRLSDISIGGCAVSAQIPRDVSAGVAVLRLTRPDKSVAAELAGKLCWAQQTSVASTSYGFQFRRPLNPAVMAEFIENGWVTRRQDERINVGGRIRVRRAHGKANIHQATLEDCSTAGVRLKVDQAVEENESLLITLDDGSGGTVRVIWAQADQSVFQCGCVFQNLASSRAVNDGARCGQSVL
ncbi:MAG: PilZ domain-containing protein [Planctomycetota bacterium]